MAEVNVNGTEYLDFTEEQSVNLLAALSRIYYIFYDVELERDTFVKYHASQLVSDFTDRFVSAHDCLQVIAKVMYVPEHEKLIADFFDTTAWPERLKDKDTEYVNAMGIRNGWIRTNLIVAVRDDKGVPTHVFVAIQNVNEAMLKDLAQTKQLASQLEEISALNAQLEDNQAELESQLEEITALNTQLEENEAELEASMAEQESQIQEINALNSEMLLVLNSMADTYFSMHLLNLAEDTAIDYKAEDEARVPISHPQGVARMVANVIKDVVTDEYRDIALRFADLSTLPERMDSTKIVSCEFVCKRVGWCRASFIEVRSGRDGMPVEIMFVTRSIDQEKKKEEVLIRTSNTDALTNLLNRRAYEAEIVSPDVYSEDLAYIAFDVNELKNVNDSFGHAAGDELLIGAADCMRESFGEYGKIFRIGGDEFVAILYISGDELEKAMSAFHRAVSDWSGKLVDHLHVATGCSTVAGDEDCVSMKQLSTLADKRMYGNKAEYYKQSGIDRRKH